MRIKITKPGIYGNDGEIEVGTEITVKDEPTGWAGRYEVLSGGDDDEGKTSIINPELGEAEIGDTTENPHTGEGVPKAPAGQNGDAEPYVVKDKGSGWYVVTQGDKEVTGSLRKNALEGFNGLTEDEKKAFVEANKPE